MLKNENERRQKIVTTLLNDRHYHIEFNGHLTNHVKHTVVALNGLGASAQLIKAYHDNYAHLTPYGYGLEPARDPEYVINQDNWQEYLGKRTNFSSYYDFFNQELKRLGKKALLHHYVPILLPGWAGSLTHATIHLGWALDIDNECMMLEGLAYLAFSYVSCHPERAQKSANASQTAFDALLCIAKNWEKEKVMMTEWAEKVVTALPKEREALHPELVRSGLQYRIAKMLSYGHAWMYQIPAWFDSMTVSEIWEQMNYLMTLLYMVEPGDFLILHFITALHAMKHLCEWLPLNEQRELIKNFWIGSLGILFSRSTFPTSQILLQLNKQYEQVYDQNASETDVYWQKVIQRAFTEEEEHNPKLVYVLFCIWKESNLSLFRLAANHFTTTPELPKSFELPISP